MAQTAARKIAQSFARYEIWLLFFITPLLLFPRGFTPWLGVVLLALLWLSRWLAAGRLSVRTPLDLPIALLLAAALLGLLVSIDRTLSWPRFWSLFLGIAWYYALVNHPGIETKSRGSIATLVLLTLAVALLSLLGTDWTSTRLLAIPPIYDRIPNLVHGLPGSGISTSGDLFNSRWVGITLGFLIPLPLAAALFTRQPPLRLLAALAALLGTAVLLLSQSVQGLLGLAVAVIILLAWWRPWTLFLLPLFALLATTAVLLIGPLRVAETLLAIDNPIGIAVVLRLDIWSRALAMIGSMPFTGIGLNTFPIVLSEFFPGYLLGPEPHAHNLYFQTLLDFGLVGLFALFWILIAWGISLVQNYRRAASRDQQVLLVSLAAGIAAYLAHGLIDSLMLGAKPSIAIWVMLALGIAPGVASVAPQTIKKHRLLGSVIPLALLVALLLLVLRFQPAALQANLGLVYAHHGLHRAHQQGVPPAEILQTAQRYLLESIQRRPENRYTVEALGRIYAWEDQNDLALQAFIRRVVLDFHDPFRHYDPPIYLRRLIRGESPDVDTYWADLISIYTRWAKRYPDHAEHVLRLAFAWRLSDPGSGLPAQVLQQGIENNAQPVALLQAYLDLLP